MAVVIHHMTLIVMEVFYLWDQAMPAKFGMHQIEVADGIQQSVMVTIR